MSTVLLAITSGIAAYKMPDIIPLLKAKNIDVQAILTQNAHHFVDSQQLSNLTGHQVWTDLFPQNFDYREVLKKHHVDHIDLADSADLMVIAPATANVIAKLAHGIADDFLTTTALAMTKPVLIYPSMNVHMWSHPAVQANIQRLKELGYVVFEPTEGPLACGYAGKGRLPEIADIAATIYHFLQTFQFLQGKKVLISSGGTQEKIDEVRYLTNRSSGKMGAALADACTQAGAEVTLLRAETAVQPRFIAKERLFQTADELENLIRDEVSSADIFFHVAAVSDFQVDTQDQNNQKGKISSEEILNLKLTPRAKILDQIKKWNPQVQLIAFKAEVEPNEAKLQEKAQKRLQTSAADAIVANDVGQTDRGFQSNSNEVIVIKKDGSAKKFPLAAKTLIAQEIVAYLFQKK